MEIRVAKHASAELHCALCHDRLPKLCASCEDCGTRLHFACRATLSRCPTLGCASGPHETFVSAPPSLFRPSREARKRQILLRQILNSASWLLVCSLLIGAVASLAPHVKERAQQVKRARVQADLAAIAEGVELYRIDMGRSPESLHDLRRPPSGRTDDWRGPYLAGDAPPWDPWGQPYVYRRYGGRVYELVSFGADGVPGGQGADGDLQTLCGVD